MLKFVFPALLLLLFFHVPASFAENMVASGCSVSTVGYLSDLSLQYEKDTGVKITVLGGGSLMGLMDLLNNRVDFAASCKGKEADDPANLDFIPVAWDALVFIVNKSNPVNNVTPNNIRDIYSGKIGNWKQLHGPDEVITSFISTPKGMGGIGQSLSKMILKGSAVTKKSNSVVLASSVAIWEQMVEKTPGGFASTGYASARKRDVKMLRLNGVEPDRKNIISGRYPLRRELYLVVKKDARPGVRRFIDYVLSRKGQKLISSYGIPALSDMK